MTALKKYKAVKEQEVFVKFLASVYTKRPIPQAV